ncbi:MAG: toxin [Candidatus Sabulitectum sp.]|nr:toxin [Candidatus Sabulitectum sp.]
MEHYKWSSAKSEKLKAERGVGFEQVVIQIEHGNVHNVYTHPNQKQYPNQQILIIEIDNYCYIAPFVENENGRFLKTIIPSRKATKRYSGGHNEKT